MNGRIVVLAASAFALTCSAAEAQMRAHGTEGFSSQQSGSPRTTQPDPRTQILQDTQRKLDSLNQLNNTLQDTIKQFGDAVRDSRNNGRSRTYDSTNDDQDASSPPSRPASRRYSDTPPTSVPGAGNSPPPQTPQPVPTRQQDTSSPQAIPSPEDLQRALIPQMDAMLFDLKSDQHDLQVFKNVDATTSLLSTIEDRTEENLPETGPWRKGYQNAVDAIGRAVHSIKERWEAPGEGFSSKDYDVLEGAVIQTSTELQNASDKSPFALFDWALEEAKGWAREEVIGVIGRPCGVVTESSRPGSRTFDTAAREGEVKSSWCNYGAKVFPGVGLTGLHGLFSYHSEVIDALAVEAETTPSTLTNSQ